MKAAILYELNKPLVIGELTMPEPGYGQVLVRIAASGTCHTQLLEIRGRRGGDPYLPHTLGHEGSGVVQTIGVGVTKVKKGDHVVISWIKGSGIDAKPPIYYRANQQIRCGKANTFMEFALISENRVTPIPTEMPLDKAALLGCAVATGVGTVTNVAKVKPGSRIAVFGAGGVGLCAIQAASAVCSGVIAVDIYEHKLELARISGAAYTINSRDNDPVKIIREMTEGEGTDYAIEATGVKEAMENAFLSIRNGGMAILIGNLPYGETISIDPFSLICGKQIIGSWGGLTSPERDFPRYVDLYLSGKLKLDHLITHRFRLEDINTAFAALEKGEVIRALIEMGK